jgi:protein phosphatase
MADAQPGDLYMLCSDGLTSMVEDTDLRAILVGDWPLEELSANLVDAANLRGGHDNVTVVLLRALDGAD